MNGEMNSAAGRVYTEEPFRIVVCAKQVPAGAQAKLDPVTKTLIRTGTGSILNPYDGFALEAALEIRDSLEKGGSECPARGGVSVTAISMGVPSAADMLKDLVARGADEGVLLTDRAFAGADTIATSYALSLGVREIERNSGPVSLVICGHMAVDGDTAQIGPELAETLGIPHVTNVLKIAEVNPAEKYLVAECFAAEGRQTLKISLPALITVSKDINVPRFPSIAGILMVEDLTGEDGGCAAVRVLGAEDVGADMDRVGKKGSATRVVRTFTPEFSHSAERFRGSGKETAAKIREIIGGLI